MSVIAINPHQIIKQIEHYTGQIEGLVNMLDQDAKLRGATKKVHTGLARIREGNNKVQDTALALYDEPLPDSDIPFAAYLTADMGGE